MYKRTVFEFSDGIRVECWTGYNKQGFTHNGTVYQDGRKLGTTKIQYYNRTWERFTFESLLERIGDKYFGESFQKEIEDIAMGHHRKAMNELEQFEKDYESLSDTTKKHLANANITVTSMEQANEIMRLSKMWDVLLNM